MKKVRTVVSDSNGLYQIVDLRPGEYSVTFTLTGFNTFRRDAIELPGEFTATINVELRVGTLEALPIDHGQLDIAMLALVLHHVPDPAVALAECARVLRK